jgi:hypothetical protein
MLTQGTRLVVVGLLRRLAQEESFDDKDTLCIGSIREPRMTKVKQLDTFYSKRKKFSEFIIIARLYIIFNNSKFLIEQYKVL